MGKVLLFLWISINAKNVATDIANRTELQLRRNRDEFLAGPRTAERRESALARFEDIWEEFTGPDGCGSAALRWYGQRCVEERMPNAAHDWAVWYLHPIKDAPEEAVIQR